MIKGVAAVWLPVTDMQRAVAFYGDTLGLPVYRARRRLERGRRQRPADRAERQRARVPRGDGGALVAFQPDGELEQEVDRLGRRAASSSPTRSPSTRGAGSCRSRTPMATTSSSTRRRAEGLEMAAVSAPAAPATAVRRAMVAGILLGVGFGGFVDGIVLHQILQWHHMLTSTGDHPATTVAGLETNTVWDALFHVAAWLCAFAGVWLLASAMRDGVRTSAPLLLGLILAGWAASTSSRARSTTTSWGIHHVHSGSAQWAFDLGFLVLGALLLAGGLALARRNDPSRRERLRPTA